MQTIEDIINNGRDISKILSEFEEIRKTMSAKVIKHIINNKTFQPLASYNGLCSVTNRHIPRATKDNKSEISIKPFNKR